eukprot:1160686-Pelagomonas_calceolata.AAC.3
MHSQVGIAASLFLEGVLFMEIPVYSEHISILPSPTSPRSAHSSLPPSLPPSPYLPGWQGKTIQFQACQLTHITHPYPHPHSHYKHIILRINQSSIRIPT